MLNKLKNQCRPNFFSNFFSLISEISLSFSNNYTFYSPFLLIISSNFP